MEAQVKHVDREKKTLLVKTEDGREITLQIDEHTSIEVMEPATAGRMDGTLEDIGVGYFVNFEFSEGAGGCKCHSLECIS
jgi:hypothetical protein